MSDKDDKTNEAKASRSGFGMHANKTPEPAAPAEEKAPEPEAQAEPEITASDQAAPSPEASSDAPPPLPEDLPPAPADDAPKFDNLPPEDIFGSDAAPADEAPKLDNLPPEDIYGSDAAPTGDAPKLDNLPPEDIYGGHAGNPAEGSTESLDQPSAQAEVPAPALAEDTPATPAREPGVQPSGSEGATIRVEDDHGERNIVVANTTQDITRHSPRLAEIVAAAGWEQAAIEEQKLDIDLSVFLLDRHGKTRKDEDFIFYNNEDILDGAITHSGDNRTGAGEGDDESVYMRLDDVPFDVMKVVFVLSVYDDEFQGHNFEMVRDVFFRIIDKSIEREIFCYPLNEEVLKGQITGIVVGEMYREGTKWMFDTKEVTETGGLAKIATDYGIVVKEMQTVDLNVADEESKI